ncbi:MAG: hypothetical protein ACRD22_09905, partial [Terriglobia bacterium]
EEEFDFSPAGMVPSHMAWEDTRQPSQYSIFERGVAHLNNFMFYITPGSLHEITQTSRQLLLLQLYKLGLPIDPWTLMEAFAIPNVGPPPLGTKSVIERWVDWNYLKAGIAARIESGMPQQQEGRGRKPTNQKAPHVETKDNGTRSTIATS